MVLRFVLFINKTDLFNPDGSKRRRFHPFRGLRRMFRRKTRTDRETEPTSTDVTTAANLTTNGDSAARSLSASELLSDQPTK